MGETEWWLYDLVVIAIGVLCIWNGAAGGAKKALGGFLVCAVSIVAASFLSAPVSEAVYDSFIRTSCRNIVEEKLDETDIAGDLRGTLESHGIYIPYDNDELADMVESFGSSDEALNKAAAVLGTDAEALEDELSDVLDAAVRKHGNVLPDWAEKAVTEPAAGSRLKDVADTTAAVLRNDNSMAAAGIEEMYIKLAAMPFLRVISFAAITFLLCAILRIFTELIPGGSHGAVGTLIGGAVGVGNMVVYIGLAVLLTECIISMGNGEYPFFSDETVGRTLIFGKFYNIITDIL